MPRTFVESYRKTFVKRTFWLDLAAVGAFTCLCFSAKAEGVEPWPVSVGLMMASIHSERIDALTTRPWNDANPGLYTQWGPLVAGTYYNSLRRQSVFAGYVYPVWANVDITFGAVTGYDGPGRTAKALMPMVIPSIHGGFPFNGAEHWGWRVNLALGVQKGSATAINFCVEYRL